MRQLAGMALVAVTLAACAHQPIVGPASERSQPGQVSYTLPPGGEVSIVVVGYDSVSHRRYDLTSAPLLHVQMTLANRGTQPWTLHSRDQIAFIESYGPSVPAEASDHPLVVAPGETRTLDLYYPIAKAEFAQAPPRRMSLQWRVRLPGGVVGDRARLDREVASVVPPRA